ncbi:MAG: pyruvate:ferredoxin (flavodoxin) oxidoreductase, partial [Rickettsiales bacterium]|nr:pyruvate:ferredoxin (flavodoxin) oxidoreductase [Rickettsiales bacterium]
MADNLRIMDANEAAADIAYRATTQAIIYPITPSSPMAESYEAWSAAGKPNIWGEIPQVTEMQSEGGAIAAVHGALNAGTLATTFTASQGLLLMIPNMYKIAGELLPLAMHVSARTVARHALSIFGDHSDVMGCRQTGFAMLASNSAQEAHDLALVAHAAALESRVPFLHFFDGFRTSHEINMLSRIDDETMRKMISDERIAEFRGRALVPERPSIRGTAQNPDVYFQAAEAANPYYAKVERIAREQMDKLGSFTGRKYAPVEYVGPRDAERIIIAMGSACETIEESLRQIPGAGLIKIRLYRPFPSETLAKAMPPSAKKIAVLDRTKEAGAREPLFLDAVNALCGRGMEIIGGRYGLSSKEFTPAMAKAVYDELAKPSPKREFTVGINDDETLLSLNYDNGFAIKSDGTEALFYGLGSDGTVGANKNSIKIITGEAGKYGQAYFEYDSKKSGGTTISHLRFSDKPIRAPYLVSRADFIAVHHFPLFYTLDVLANAKDGGALLINSPFREDKLWGALPREAQNRIIAKKLRVFYINAGQVARSSGMGRRINTIMQTAFFHLAGIIPPDKAAAAIKKAIEKTYAKKGPEVVEMNFKAVDAAIANIHELKAGEASGSPMPSPVAADATEFVRNLTAEIIAGRGNDLPVSAFASVADGTFPSGTARYEKRGISDLAPKWDPAKCIQCGKCAFICPHAAIRTKATRDAIGVPMKTKELGEGLNYIVAVSPKDCTGCTLCATACPVQALSMEQNAPDEHGALECSINVSRETFNPSTVKHVSLMEPLFEFSGACAGCGEAGYIRLATQLFGERMMIANATGCSSIYGGNLPTTPYAKSARGMGPAWSNSLFEDNAEYGYGQAVSARRQAERARALLSKSGYPGADEILGAPQATEADIETQRARIEKLKSWTKDRELKLLADFLIKKSIWIIGGDGWAYDIGYGGLDHVLAGGENVNVLVLDTEVYSNTGGQASKSTPRGASAKFASAGKGMAKKDLGLIAMMSMNAYVAKIAMGANEAQAIKAMREAEAFDGPSIIIAYSPCIAHGIDLAHGPAQSKAAVESGHWELYRFNPRLESPLSLDS